MRKGLVTVLTSALGFGHQTREPLMPPIMILGRKVLQTLGTRAQIPIGYMVKTLRSQSTFDSNMPSDQMLTLGTNTDLLIR